MGTVRYTNFNGQIIAESRNGVRKTYRTDALSSVVGQYDNTLTQTYTASYWAYGETRTTTGSTTSKFGYVGGLGCRAQADGGIYMRARVLETETCQWLTVDPLWPYEQAYGYSRNKPTAMVDPKGLGCVDLKNLCWDHLPPRDRNKVNDLLRKCILKCDQDIMCYVGCFFAFQKSITGNLCTYYGCLADADRNDRWANRDDYKDTMSISGCLNEEANPSLLTCYDCCEEQMMRCACEIARKAKDLPTKIGACTSEYNSCKDKCLGKYGG